MIFQSMKPLIFKSTLIALLMVPAVAFSASTSKSAAKKSVALKAGEYIVTDAKSDLAKEDICVEGASHDVKWSQSSKELTLHIGERLTFMDLNDGLVTDSEPYYADGCSYSRNAQTQDHRVIADVYTNCKSLKKTEHSEIIVNKDESFTYAYNAKLTKDGKTVESNVSCRFSRPAKK